MGGKEVQTAQSAPRGTGGLTQAEVARQIPLPIRRHRDPIAEAVRTYLLTGQLPAPFSVSFPGADRGPGRAMTGYITPTDIQDQAQGWYIAPDGELYQKGDGPGVIRRDKEGLAKMNWTEKVKEALVGKEETFADWNN
ncbi:hypothetical protein HDU85_006719 [Gaertneriomyces sp. JEL0708]|nr:hypothetical protein HDU85_006719 [Gaertneriomyces sp. JEL0708]